MKIQDKLTVQNEIGKEILASTNIWTAIEHLTNQLGSKVGQHLETLLCKELNHRPTLSEDEVMKLADLMA